MPQHRISSLGRAPLLSLLAMASAALLFATVVGAAACQEGAAAGRTAADAPPVLVPSPRVQGVSAEPPSAPSAPVYPANSWMAKIEPPVVGHALPIACLDANGDLRLNGADSADFIGLDFALVRTTACLPFSLRQELFVEEAPAATACDGAMPAPALVVAIGGGGTDLLDLGEGSSVGLLGITNLIRQQAAPAGIPTRIMLSTSALEAADPPQIRMVQFLIVNLAHRLAETPCLRVIVMGHSHGAVAVTSVVAALEPHYGPRLLGVLLDRSFLYYDPPTGELPVRARMLNFYQTNEGWHGLPLDTPNVTNLDMSGETAPLEPRDGPLPIVAVAHSTLDDSPGVQATVAAQVLAWLQHPPAQ